ncbi:MULTISPECIES: phosphatase PAP2 family protein [unclassified Mesorhizobium]|uniref:phosphatase PAP2 family protein n=1 Tax=unclassified Mesorhizobium TaxID=325217 RepID=UPI000F754F3A|nr:MULTISPECIES: phosphatase PAP2 family protein [unclassified Mesorhizobium]TIU57226.1 MAG: hypothetical protein E5W35_10025 [Mesorhizobium sp.]AZO05629.1 hypothetical protein EJ068_23090 [Mesorhizobium sp. M2A.F.Ca.ET.043.02.1.1]RUW75545.1 hypothetical protein EOA28_15145 [Mesorhizobium sp. M2A.F.Ca.ET.067.02.1.1]TIV41641.1 MAG: hypothetical protein E5V91_02430 [Mesorhizobium sp.]TIW88865.1 MAG: hypothetical protein E5V52_00780 [Mesorhizobium sp.]
MRGNKEGQLRTAVRYSLVQNGPFVALVLIYIAGWGGWQLFHGGTFEIHLFSHDFFAASIAFVSLTYLLRLIYLLGRKIPKRPFSEFRRIVKDDLPFLVLGVPILAVIPTFFSAFGQIKNSMHRWIPIYADPYLARFDQAIFGDQAWMVLTQIFGSPAVVVLLDYAYMSWFLVMYSAVFTAAFMRSDPERRFRFFTTYFLSWIILGNVAAILFDSAGPCFYGIFYPENPFSPLFVYLQGVAASAQPLMALNIQNYLIGQYKSGGGIVGDGISAFPSLHVGMATLIAIFFYDMNRIIGIAAFGFCAIIFIGSIVLGWHYAIDGIASFCAVPILWRFSKFVHSRFPTWSVRWQLDGEPA